VNRSQTVAFTTSDGVAIAGDYWPGAGLAYVVAHGSTGFQRDEHRAVE